MGSKVNDQVWRRFFELCSETLGRGARSSAASENWCAWTTFGSLADSVHYWSAGLPNPEDLSASGVGDRGVWGQPFLYRDIAHVIIPREFYWQNGELQEITSGVRKQDLDKLSAVLFAAGIEHRLTDLVLEIKVY